MVQEPGSEEPTITITEPSATGPTLDADVGPGGADERPSSTLAVALFSASTFTGSFLLFLVQPMVAKMLLPSLGGTPSVWNTSMVFFEVVLVAGYGLAHLGLRLFPGGAQRATHVVAFAVAALALPVAIPGGWRPPVEGSPTGWLLVVLAVMVGGPFLMLSTLSPTIQSWFTTADATHGRDPYFLYAAGNAGSLLGLLAYPTLVEPHLTLDQQSRWFSAGYLALVGLLLVCSSRRRAAPPGAVADADRTPTATGDKPAETGITWAQRVRWLAWSAVPSALLLGVTRHLTTDVMSLPLLWIAPLGLYLVTFIVAFGRHPDGAVTVAARGLQLLVIPVAITLLGVSTSLAFVLVLHLAVFFMAALLGHSRLAQSRPGAAHLTEFYLVLSIGGAVGGALVALVAPLVFRTVIEYPLALVAALAMCPRTVRADTALRRFDTRAVVSGAAVLATLGVALHVRGAADRRELVLTALVIGLAAIAAFKLARTPAAYAGAVAVLMVVTVLPAAGILATERSFFGVTRVQTDPIGRHQLLSGSTVHGLQDVDGRTPDRPLAYYFPAGPIGQYFTRARPPGDLDVGIIGLGSGALAGYGEPGDHFTYYEIDPAVVKIARDPHLFSYLADSEASIDIRLGDGRLSLERTSARYDALVLDAFSSDSIPIHLLTREAIQTYLGHLRPGGLIAVHISNRYFDLEPVLARLAHDLGLAGIVEDYSPTPEEEVDGAVSATWVMLAPDAAALARTAALPGWEPLDPSGAGPAWTDSYSNVLQVLHPS